MSLQSKLLWDCIKFDGIKNKRTECEPSQFDSSREHIASSQCSPTVLCGFWMCISIVDWNKSVPQFLGVWPLTFRGHLRSKIFSPFESPNMTAYLTFIYTFSLSHTVYEIFYFKVFRLWPWFLKVKNIFTIRKPIHDFLPNFHWHFLLYRFWDIWLQSFQGLTLTFRGHLGLKIFSRFESLYTTYYLFFTDTLSLSRTVFEIFDFKVRFWTFECVCQLSTRIKLFLIFCPSPPQIKLGGPTQ